LVGLLLCAAFTLQCHDASSRGRFNTVEPVTVEVLASATPASFPAKDKNERLAHTDPLEFFRRCREHYDQTIHGYRCNFLKQERVGDKLTAEQVTDVRFLNDPYSVDMVWTRNPGPAARALYVKGKWRNDKGQDEAWVRPSGAVLGLLKLKQPIDGPRAHKAARRRIDQFGFRNSLDLIIKYSEEAARNHELDLRFIGNGSIAKRPTYVFERRLPYTGQEEPYPDRLLVVHVDKEWLVPTGCLSYADDAGTELLGKYILYNVQLNPGYSPADFDPNRIGF
jgi:hypothetical protein